jgi:hypothetical protein
MSLAVEMKNSQGFPTATIQNWGAGGGRAGTGWFSKQ